ncbi:hypothetical protein EJB05_20325 [Eragrostis curvula]|uniref:RING-type E3 ubiquitin transferase n=1 Tax=Eragrostis curvula TaxID=38414 RepID=A0A5J9UY12_9POAL|nr:hypothetical protein EJB05_20325 [Eragrostis curvula]
MLPLPIEEGLREAQQRNTSPKVSLLINEGLREVQHFREKAYEESTKRQKAERDLVSALQMVGEWKMLHQHEMWQRQAVEESYLRDRKEVREMIRRFEMIYDQLDDVQELKQRVTEMESARKYHKEELAMSKHFLERLQADNEKLQQELKRCTTEMESARKDHEKELAASKFHVEMIQADAEKRKHSLEKLRQELESARKYRDEELAASKFHAQMLQADNEKQQQELKRRMLEIESARKYHKERLAMSKRFIEMVQADKKGLQQKLDAALAEAEELRLQSCLSSASEADGTTPPSYFVCPISQEMMNDPHIAADGFTYEGEEIRGWLHRGHDTSPMTNLKLTHCELTPNRALRSAILEWQQQHRHS